MTEKEKQFARWCVENDTHKFYVWAKWRKARAKVLRSDRYECQRCKNVYHRYRRADTVHHVNHLKDRPDLALSMYYDDPVKQLRRRNLISLCHECHEELHGYRKRAAEAEPVTEERWD